jgi:hypothetical protein
MRGTESCRASEESDHRHRPVGAGYVDSLARPGGNATGFTNFWVIGLFVGIELIFYGGAWIALALGLRSLG